VVGLFFVGMFIAVVCAYGCTEFLLARLDARRRVLVGEGHSLLLILTVNGTSLLILWLGSMALIVASGTGFYVQAAVICLAAQALWLTQHLWAYYRDHLRLRF
jgi:hypothetical protein